MSFSLLTLITVLGWVGAVAGLLAYGMVTKGRWTAGSRAFQLTNVTAAALMLMVAAVNGVWPSVAANAAWVVVGGQALMTLRAQARERQVARPAELSVAEPVECDSVPAQATAPARLDLAA
jgi:hypothetical protein